MNIILTKTLSPTVRLMRALACVRASIPLLQVLLKVTFPFNSYKYVVSIHFLLELCYLYFYLSTK